MTGPGTEAQIGDMASRELIELRKQRSDLITGLRKVNHRIARLETTQAAIGVETATVSAEGEER